MTRIPINPPGPAYRIPKGTPASVCRNGFPEAQRDHLTTRELTFDSCLCRHGPQFYVFENAGWLLRVWQEHVIHTPHPKVVAIHFTLESKSGYRALQVWPDTYGEATGLRPLDSHKTLLDVRRGDTLRPLAAATSATTSRTCSLAEAGRRILRTAPSPAVAGSWSSIE